MKPYLHWLLAIFTLLVSVSVHASEASIKAAMGEKFPYQKLISVKKTPYLGLYEVAFEDQLFYTDEKMRYLFSGSIIDLKNMANLTDAREKQLYPLRFDSLPLQQAIKKVVGNGKRRVAVFSDPNCGYCRKLEHEMVHLTDVTIYIFPLTFLHGSVEKARDIWCARDRLAAWENHMLYAIEPATNSCDTHDLATIADAAKKFNVNVTPTLIFEDGFTKAGWMEAEPLDQQLTESSSKK